MHEESTPVTELFEQKGRPFVTEYATEEGEFDAVADRRKAMSFTQWPFEDIGYQEYGEQIAAALSRGLCVVEVPWVYSSADSQREFVNVFVLHADQLWRVSAFEECQRALYTHGPSDGLRAMTSSLLGYTAEQFVEFMAFEKFRRLPVGDTIYLILDTEQRSELTKVASRCVTFETTDVVAIFVRGYWVARHDAAKRLEAEGRVLVRLGVNEELFTELFGTPADWGDQEIMTRTLSSESRTLINRNMTSRIQTLSGDGRWVT